MTGEHDDSAIRDQWVQDILHAYLQAVDAGQAPDEAELVRRHPDLAAELEVFFRDQAKLDQLARSRSPGAPAHDGEAPTLPPDPPSTANGASEIVRHFGDYELIEEIARGGMGVVYKARQVSLNRVVALKMILAGQLASDTDIQRFRAEAEAAANLDHPHIVPIYEVGEHQGQHYFSMKLIDGSSLTPRVPQLVHDPKAAAGLLATVAWAVHHAHQRGILHRDLKPGNVLLDVQGQPHVTDFGLAKRVDADQGQTKTGAIVGTPSYMAPEQARSEKVLTTAVDVYSLGAILYELLTGRPPFRAETPLDTVLQVLDREPDRPRLLNPRIDPDLETICLKCLEKEPPRRYDSAAALADDLERWLAGEPISARPSTNWERAVTWAKRKPAAAALLAVSALATLTLVGVIIGFTIRLQTALKDTEKQRDLADKESQRAGKQEQLALQGERLARLYWYGADLNLAQQALEAGNGIRFLSALQRQVPRPGQEDLRTFEWHYLWRLGHAQRATLTGHTQPVNRLAYSPDGRWLATAGQTELKVWDAATGREQWTFTLPVPEGDGSQYFAIKVLVFSPDSRTLLAGTSETDPARNHPQVHVWDSLTGKKVTALKEITGSVYALTFADEGRTLRVVEDSQNNADLVGLGTSLRLWSWNLADGRGEATRLPLSGWAMSLSFGAAFTQDGKILAVSGSGLPRLGFLVGRATWITPLWDVPTGQPKKVILKPGFYSALAFAPDGQTLAAAGFDSRIKRYQCDTGKELGALGESGNHVHSLVYSPDGRFLAAADDTGAVNLFNLATGRKETAFFGHAGEVQAVIFSPDGKTLATGGIDHTVKLWDSDLRPGPEVIAGLAKPPNELIPNELQAMKLSRDGKTLFLGQYRQVRCWDLTTGKEREPLQGFDRGASGSVNPFIAMTARIGRLAVSSDGRLLAAHGLVGTKVWDLTTAQELAQFTNKEGFENLRSVWSGSLYFTPDGKHLVSAGDCWEVGSWEKPTTPIPEDLLKALAFSPDGTKLVTALPEKPGEALVVVRVLPTGQPVSQRRFSTYADTVKATFSPDGRTMALGGHEGAVWLWQPATGQEPESLQGHTKAIADLVFSPDGRTLATASGDGTVKLWDPVTGQERLTLRRDNQLPREVLFAPDGAFLAVNWTDPNNQAVPPAVTLYRAR